VGLTGTHPAGKPGSSITALEPAEVGLEELNGGRLAGSVGAQQTEQLARLHLQVQTVKGNHVAVLFSQTFRVQHLPNVDLPWRDEPALSAAG
jgi:hypothetical protein